MPCPSAADRQGCRKVAHSSVTAGGIETRPGSGTDPGTRKGLSDNRSPFCPRAPTRARNHRHPGRRYPGRRDPMAAGRRCRGGRRAPFHGWITPPHPGEHGDCAQGMNLHRPGRHHSSRPHPTGRSGGQPNDATAVSAAASGECVFPRPGCPVRSPPGTCVARWPCGLRFLVRSAGCLSAGVAVNGAWSVGGCHRRRPAWGSNRTMNCADPTPRWQHDHRPD